MKILSGEISAPAAMVAGRPMTIVPAVMAGMVGIVTVDGIAAKRTDAAADKGSGQRVAVEGRRKAGAGHRSYGGSGKNAMFARAAGCEGNAEQGGQAEYKEAAHNALLGFGDTVAGGREAARPPRRGAGRMRRTIVSGKTAYFFAARARGSDPDQL